MRIRLKTGLSKKRFDIPETEKLLDANPAGVKDLLNAAARMTPGQREALKKQLDDLWDNMDHSQQKHIL